jgi:hypothetical protein
MPFASNSTSIFLGNSAEAGGAIGLVDTSLWSTSSNVSVIFESNLLAVEGSAVFLASCTFRDKLSNKCREWRRATVF